jgi:hypothetical protein
VETKKPDLPSGSQVSILPVDVPEKSLPDQPATGTIPSISVPEIIEKPFIPPSSDQGLISLLPGNEPQYPVKTGENNGVLNLADQPAGLGVYIDNQYQGLTPLILTDLSEGQYRITFEKDDEYRDQVVTIPKTGEEISLPKGEPEYKVVIFAGDKEPCTDCCIIEETTAKISTRDYSELFKVSTIASIPEGTESTTYTLYWNGKPWYKGELTPDSDITSGECQNCRIMEDYIRVTAPPGSYEIRIDEGRLCTSDDNRGRLIFYGKEGIPNPST